MVITILEAHVELEKVSILKQAFEAGLKELPPQMIQTFLANSPGDPTLWRGISVWRSRSALMEYRQ